MRCSLSRRNRRSKTQWQAGRRQSFDGRLGNKVGDRSEARVLRILTELETPNWFLSARAATPEEDAQQKDVIVLTDKGEIGVQVKSGKTSFIKFKRNPANSMIALVMVKGRYDDKMILKEILKELEEIRSVMENE